MREIRTILLKEDYSFHHPLSMILSGSSGSGKVRISYALKAHGNLDNFHFELTQTQENSTSSFQGPYFLPARA